MAFIDGIKAKAKEDKKIIVLPESKDRRVLIAAAHILEEGLADLVMVGNEEKIMDGAGWLEIDLTGLKVEDPTTSDKFEHYVEVFTELRAKKGMTPEKAREILLSDYITYAVMMLKCGDADGVVAGACHATSDTLRPALQILKTAPGSKIVSGFFVMDVPDCRYGKDGAKSFHAMVGGDPYVAMLSHSTKGSAKHALVDKVVEATQIAKREYPDLKVDGELQADAAMVPAVAKSKAKGSPVAGKANVLIFPNLDAGNIGYKLVQRLGKADAYGPMLQGIAKPVNDLSRGCSWEDIVGVVAITAVQAQMA